MAQTILITGGSGLIGQKLSLLLNNEGYKVRWLSRSPDKYSEFPCFYWDPMKGDIDSNALVNVDYVIHLAGAGIANKRWTKSYKEEIIDSRVQTAAVIHGACIEGNHSLKAFISASGTGYYGAITSDTVFDESDKPANDFIGLVTQKWEQAAGQFKDVADRVVMLRTSLVVAKNEGALQKMNPLFKRGLGAAVGSGNQYMPWVDIDDVCNAYLFAIRNEIKGPFNLNSDETPTNQQFSRQLASAHGKKLWLPNVPSFALKLMYGEMSVLLLKGSRVSNDRLKKEGFEYIMPSLKESLAKAVD